MAEEMDFRGDEPWRLRARAKNEVLRLRIDGEERVNFRRAASLSGLTLSAWVRVALREAAERRLQTAGEAPAWVR